MNVVTELVKEDFEDKDAGQLDSNEWEVTVPGKAAVAEKDGNQYLSLKGNDPNLNVTKLQDGETLQFGSNVTEFDFCFPEDMGGSVDYVGFITKSAACLERTIYIQSTSGRSLAQRRRLNTSKAGMAYRLTTAHCKK